MLTHNPLAEMYGPTFLLLYAVVILLSLAVCAWAVSRFDTTDDRRLPLVPPQPDALEIAYLRGGENEVLRVALFDLIQRGCLQVQTEVNGKRVQTAAQRLALVSPLPDKTRLSPIERKALDYFTTAHAAQEIFRSGLPNSIKGLCVGYEQALCAEHLLFSKDRAGQATRIGWKAVTVILAFGGYKLLAALANGHDNVGFLIVLGIIGSSFVAVVCGRRRLTRRGKAYVGRLQQAFVSLRRQGAGTRQAVGVLVSQDTASPAALDPAVLLLAVFGTSVLTGTPHAYYGQMFVQSSGGGGCGGSGGCGSGGGCGGGGCGGCGGGG